MKTILYSMMMLAASLPSLFSPAMAAGKTKDCPVQKVTSAYLDLQQTKAKDVDLGKYYQAFMDKVQSLDNSKNFKHLKLVSHSIDLQPDYSNKDFTKVMIRASIEFALNYQAVTELSNLVPGATINVSTYDVKKCEELKNF